jgi:hypothetical protein
MLTSKVIKKFRFQQGQTLIETMVACFILIMGINAAVGLAIFALSSSTNITKQIVGMGLAREGIEAVRNIRDTNWLKQTSINLDCYNYATGNTSPDYPAANGGARCYKNWLTEVQYYGVSAATFDIDPGVISPQNMIIAYDPQSTGDRFWRLGPVIAAIGLGNWGLRFSTATSTAAFGGYYSLLPADLTNGISSTDVDGDDHTGTRYFRTIVLTRENTPNPPYGQVEFNRLRVDSRVWWTDKKCPVATTWATTKATCRIELTTYLTNWKNY